jgi:hypothetical protein
MQPSQMARDIPRELDVGVVHKNVIPVEHSVLANVLFPLLIRDAG